MTDRDVVPLRDYLESLVAAERDLREAKFVSVAELAEKHNDLIRQMERRDRSYLTEDEYNARHEDLVRRVNLVENQVSALQGGSAIRATTVGWLLAGAGLFISIVVVVANLLTH